MHSFIARMHDSTRRQPRSSPSVCQPLIGPECRTQPATVSNLCGNNPVSLRPSPDSLHNHSLSCRSSENHFFPSLLPFWGGDGLLTLCVANLAKLVKVSQSFYFGCQGLDFCQGLSRSRPQSRRGAEAADGEKLNNKRREGGGNHQAGGWWQRLKTEDVRSFYSVREHNIMLRSPSISTQKEKVEKREKKTCKLFFQGRKGERSLVAVLSGLGPPPAHDSLQMKCHSGRQSCRPNPSFPHAAPPPSPAPTRLSLIEFYRQINNSQPTEKQRGRDY